MKKAKRKTAYTYKVPYLSRENKKVGRTAQAKSSPHKLYKKITEKQVRHSVELPGTPLKLRARPPCASCTLYYTRFPK